MSRSLPRLLRRSFLVVALAVGSAPLASAAHADPPAATTTTASAFLDAKLKAVRTLLGSPASPDREKKLDAELKTLLDYDDMAKIALGVEYDKHSKEELTEFTGLLRQLIEKNYKKRLEDTLKYQISNMGEQPQGSDVLVKTQATNLKDKKAAPVQIDYVVRKKGSGWIAVDLIPEGSSMAKTYHKEFSKVIKKDGWAALIKKMKDKLAKS